MELRWLKNSEMIFMQILNMSSIAQKQVWKIFKLNGLKRLSEQLCCVYLMSVLSPRVKPMVFLKIVGVQFHRGKPYGTLTIRVLSFDLGKLYSFGHRTLCGSRAPKSILVW
mmetsp:Transcript_14549/g.22942  ORF Transcript_14549/g.22942 Transcript_14549/m.22942 type:complete len:111 (+) Transcript_14549:346-678(+)